MINRRRFSLIAAVALAAATTLAAPHALAQSYPGKPVRLIIPFPPGGATDILGRVLAQKLGDQLGGQVVVDNRPGAGGAIGSEQAAKSASDGYTILLATVSTHSVGPALNPKMPYDVKRDFTPVIHMADATNVLIVSPEQFARVIERETAKFAAVVKRAGLKPE